MLNIKYILYTVYIKIRIYKIMLHLYNEPSQIKWNLTWFTVLLPVIAKFLRNTVTFSFKNGKFPLQYTRLMKLSYDRLSISLNSYYLFIIKIRVSNATLPSPRKRIHLVHLRILLGGGMNLQLLLIGKGINDFLTI